MAVYKQGADGEERYIVDIVWKDATGRRKRIRRSPPIQTLRGAQQYEREVRNALQAGTFESVTNVKFKELIERYKTDHLSQLKPSSQQTQGHSLRLWILPHFKDVDLSDLNPKHIADFRGLLLSRMKASTVVRHLLVLRTILGKGKEWGMLASFPKVALPKVPQKRPRFFAFEEVDRLAAAAPGMKFGSMSVFACRTGLRVGELMELQWSDVDLERKLITISRSVFWDDDGVRHVGGTKSGLIRSVPLSDQAHAILEALPHRTGYVFTNDDGSQIRKNQTDGALRRLCKKASIAPAGWHVCRHTFASHLAIKGVPLLSIQQLLGHASLKMTLVYAHLSPAALVAAVGVLP